MAKNGCAYRNPADALGLGRDATLGRFLRAAEADEAAVTGQMSDYDSYVALAAALPLYAGHPRVAAMHRVLCAETVLNASLCPHTARAHWDAWVERHWYGQGEAMDRKIPEAGYPATCPFCAVAEPTWLTAEAVVKMPLPEALVEAGDDLRDWSERLCARVPRDGRRLLIRWPVGGRFVRPDVYHAGLAVQSAAEGRLTAAERDVLWMQMLRVVGGALLAVGGQLLLVGGAAEDVVPLLAYLKGARCLPSTVWLCRESCAGIPASVAAVSGLYAEVGTGIWIPAEADEDAVAQMCAAYASVAPIGRCVLWRE